MLRMVVDTNVLVSAMLAPAGEPRSVLRLCLNGEVVPLVGNALFSEYETVFARSSLFANCLIDRCERKQLVDAFLACCEWIAISFLWRPNLADEADNHPVELAVAGNADAGEAREMAANATASSPAMRVRVRASATASERRGIG